MTNLQNIQFHITVSLPMCGDHIMHVDTFSLVYDITELKPLPKRQTDTFFIQFDMPYMSEGQ